MADHKQVKVHERSVEIDLLLLEARELLKSRRDLKLILMSATIDTTRFAQYYDSAPIIEIPGQMFPVEDLWVIKIVGRNPTNW
jgi:ATP-dependent RNA helicase DHX57